MFHLMKGSSFELDSISGLHLIVDGAKLKSILILFYILWNFHQKCHNNVNLVKYYHLPIEKLKKKKKYEINNSHLGSSQKKNKKKNSTWVLMIMERVFHLCEQVCICCLQWNWYHINISIIQCFVSNSKSIQEFLIRHHLFL